MKKDNSTARRMAGLLYDNGRLQAELAAANERAETLARQSESLNRDLALAHKSLHEQLEMIQSQERELADLRATRARLEDDNERQQSPVS